MTEGSVVVAMSGGVDSSVSACLLAEQGYDVLGSHMKLVHLDGVEHGCCGPQAEADARAVARTVGLPFEVVDMSDVFGSTVLADFFDEHERGWTPNPCVRCNEHIKFGAFLAEHAPHLVTEGEVVDPTGAVVGRHDGTFRFTIGQRRGIGVSTGERTYVVDVDRAANRVVVGPGELLARRGLVADRISWVAGMPPADGPFEAEVRIRYRGDDVSAVIEPIGHRARVEFRSTQRAIAPGQSVVFYRGEELLGGGRITEALR